MKPNKSETNSLEPVVIYMNNSEHPNMEKIRTELRLNGRELIIRPLSELTPPENPQIRAMNVIQALVMILLISGIGFLAGILYEKFVA